MKHVRLSEEAVDELFEAALLPRFPYAVVFMEVRGDIRVLAVAHAKRRPGYWINRVIG